jgi:hypothetical protein
LAEQRLNNAFTVGSAGGRYRPSMRKNSTWWVLLVLLLILVAVGVVLHLGGMRPDWMRGLHGHG